MKSNVAEQSRKEILQGNILKNMGVGPYNDRYEIMEANQHLRDKHIGIL